MFNNPLYIIFSDLDGTLLDHDTYEYTDAAEALEYIKREKIPLVLCSSKTRPEIEYYRTRLGLEDPFISENGAAIFISKGTLDIADVPFVEYEGYKVIELAGVRCQVSGSRDRYEGYKVIELGVPYNRIKSCFAEIKAETGLKLLGFSEMSVAQVVEFTGLSHDAAKLAHMRDYSEPFLFMEEESRLEVLERAVHKKGLKITKGGRFYHLIGDNDKGKALRIVRKLYEQEGRSLISIGLGDSLNDLPMLENVDIPVLVQKKTGEYEPWTGNKKIVLAPGIGPKGWNRAVLEIFRIEE